MQFGTFNAHKILLLYIPPVLIILGTFGNVFSFLILKNRAMLKFSTYFYLMVMAVADTLVLYVGLLRLWVGELTGLDIRDRTDWTCKLTNVIGYTVSDFSVWLIIAVTVERYMVVCHPFQASSVCSSARAHRIVAALLIIFTCLNLHFCWTVHIAQFVRNGYSIPQCTALEVHARLVLEAWPWVDTLVYSLLPFVLIVALNGMIIRQVLVARGRRTDLRNYGNKYEQRRPSQEGSTRLTVMLMTISFAFLLTTLPMSVVNIASALCRGECSDDERRQSAFRLARTVTELLMYANHSVNFFLYCATGQKFRHQLMWMVCYTKRRRTYLPNWRSEPTTPPVPATRLASIRDQPRFMLQRKQRPEVTSDTRRCAVSWKKTTSLSQTAGSTCEAERIRAKDTPWGPSRRLHSACKRSAIKYCATSINGLAAESAISYKSVAKGAASI